MSKKKVFWVDFSASIQVEANSKEEAREFLFNVLPEGIEYAEVNGVEEVPEEEDNE